MAATTARRVTEVRTEATAVRIAHPAIAAAVTVAAADIPPAVAEGIQEAAATAVVAIAKQDCCFGKAELQ
jgi:hypothetical protein